MKNSKIKIAAVAMGAALSVTMLLGGAMLNNSAITASADENDEISTVDSSSTSITRAHAVYDGMVYYTCTATMCKYLILDTTSTAFANGITIGASGNTAVYNEVKIPTGGSKVTNTTYRFARATGFSTVTTQIYDSYSSVCTPVVSLTSGTLKADKSKPFSVDLSYGDEIYITCAYNGLCADYGTYYQVHTDYDSTPLEISVGGITYKIQLKVGAALVTASSTVTLSSTVNNQNHYGAIVFSEA